MRLKGKMSLLIFFTVIMYFPLSVLGATTIDVPPMQYYSTSFETSTDNIAVHVKVEVLSGPAIDVLLMDEANYNVFVQQIQNGYYQVNVYMNYQNVRKVDRDIKLGEKGRYYLVLINMDQSEKSTVSYEITSVSSEGSLGGLLFLVVIVIIPIAIYLYKKKKQ